MCHRAGHPLSLALVSCSQVKARDPKVSFGQRILISASPKPVSESTQVSSQMRPMFSGPFWLLPKRVWVSSLHISWSGSQHGDLEGSSLQMLRPVLISFWWPLSAGGFPGNTHCQGEELILCFWTLGTNHSFLELSPLGPPSLTVRE